MSDLDFLLTGLMVVPLIYAALTVRKSGQRLHYRDRPLFWLTLSPLLLPSAVGLWVAGQMTRDGVALLWQLSAVLMACAVAGVVWWIDLDPTRLVRRQHVRG